MDDGSGWCTIESSPAVFTELLSGIGVEGLQVEELYALDRDLFMNLAPIHGLVFLFRYRPTEGAASAARSGRVCDPAPEGVFFAKQVIQNACATQALLGVILNASSSVQLGSELENFKSFTGSFDSGTKGLAISNSEVLRTVHNSFSPRHFAIENAPVDPGDKEEPYHFVAYVPVNGHVYELDGLQAGPREHAAIPDGADWLDVVTPVVQSRMAEYMDEGEIRFTLLAVCDDVRARLKKELGAMPGDSPQRPLLEDILLREEKKRSQWDKDNARRKHNFVPLILNTLKALAMSGDLKEVVDKASERKQKAAEAQAQGDAKKASASS